MNQWEKEKLDEYMYTQYGGFMGVSENEYSYMISVVSKSSGFQLYCLQCAKEEFKDTLSKEWKPVLDKLELFLKGFRGSP